MSGKRPRDRVLLAELYVLSYRDERYAELTRTWMHGARAALSRAVGDDLARALDATQEGLTLQRYFLPEEVDEPLIHSTLHAVASRATVQQTSPHSHVVPAP